MNVKPVLGDWEIPRINNIQSLEQRRFVELDIPARTGSLFQDMNSSPTRVQISGSLYGDEIRNEFLETLRGKFKEGEPVTFVGDIITATEVQYVVIESLQFEESGYSPNQMSYRIVLKESPPPPPPPDPLGGIDTDLLDQAGGLLDSVSSAMDVIDALGNVPDFTDPTPPLTGIIDEASKSLEAFADIGSDLASLFGEAGS